MSKRRKSPVSYQDRTYRQIAEQGNLVSSYIHIQETDLHVLATRRVEDEVFSSVIRYRNQLENYILRHPGFQDSLIPLSQDPLAPPVVKDMLLAGEIAKVGPMAAVAGVIAEYVGRDLLEAGLDEVIVENGGDLFVSRRDDCTVSIFAGESPLSGKVGIVLKKNNMPLGVCCSSATVGHSLSLGHADAVVVIAQSAAIADATATRLGNEVRQGGGDNFLTSVLDTAKKINEIQGVAIVKGDRLAAWGNVEFVKL